MRMKPVCNMRTDSLLPRSVILRHADILIRKYTTAQCAYIYMYILVHFVCFRNMSHMSAYLWITILRQDLQHRRFSALNVSHKNQFTSHDQRLRVSSFLHGVNGGPVFLSLFSQKMSKTRSRTAQKSSQWDRCLLLGGCVQLIWLNLPLRLFIQPSGSQ